MKRYFLSRGLSYSQYMELRTIPEPNSGCLSWLGPTGKNGYGSASWKGSMVLAHRLAWMKANKKRAIPRGMVICHKCDVRSCVNPTHLVLGSYAENTHQMLVRGRHRPFSGKGMRNPRALLTDSDVLAIRRRVKDGENMTRLSEEYGVTQSMIGHIKYRRSWRHLP